MAQADWIRRLARGLVHDPNLAEDLEQQTWLQALRRAPTRVRDVRSWIATVMLNALRGMGSRESARRRRELLTAQHDVSPSADDVAERVMLQQRVSSAVLALAPAYRSVVLLRYYENLPPREIAQKLGLPVETVRTRVKRGLAQLREALDRDCGESWTAGLLAWLEPSRQVIAAAAHAHASGTAQVARGAILMSTRAKIGAALAGAVLVTVLGVGVWQVIESLTSRVPHAPDASGRSSAGAIDEARGEPVRTEVRSPAPVAGAPAEADGAASLDARNRRARESAPAGKPTPKSPAPPPSWSALIANGSLGAPLAGKYLELITNVDVTIVGGTTPITFDEAQAKAILAAADGTYQATLEHLGFATPAELSPRIPVVLFLDESRYHEIGNSIEDVQDSAKSSVYSCFCTTSATSFQHLGVVVWTLNLDYTKYMAMQAAAELAVRQEGRGKKVPRWFLEGVACCEGRFFRPEIARWSTDGLVNSGGLKEDIRALFAKRLVSVQSILESGLVIAYARDASATRDVKDAYAATLRELRARGDDQYLEENAKLEIALWHAGPRLRDYAATLQAVPVTK